MMSAAAVETAAMRIVTHVTARMYPFPPAMSGMALRTSCQMNPTSGLLRGRRVLDVDELAVGEAIDHADLAAAPDRPLAGLG